MVKRSAMAGLAMVLGIMLISAPAAEARNLYFDIWCEEQGFDEKRCDERRAEDVKQFEEYWRSVERYEERYYVEREDDKNFRDKLNNLDNLSEPGLQSYDPSDSPRPE
ncbi:MAG: hypothetical protein ACK5YG_14305 [Alphaproteobacteria bacterium]|jgi:hypothetical protein